MKLLTSILSFILLINSAAGQTEDEVLAEAYLLYHSEMASWNGSDIFLEKFPEKRSLIGGYFSYSEDQIHTCVFFDKDENPNTLASLSFNSDFDLNQVVIDTIKRKLTPFEKELFTIRQLAINEIIEDTLFKHFNNTNLNPIPIVTKNEKKVFILTGPQISGVVILGNDYLLTFNKKNRLKSKKTLHKNIIPIEYSPETKGSASMHSHLKSTGDLITSTDLCTLMLYQKYAGWTQHIVISDKNVSIWDCEKNKLFVMTRKAWDKISEYQNE